jgi:ribosomal protein S12 methylthiotransferase accessory factor
LEATSHALCEVIERDATTLWNLRSSEARTETRVDLSTVDDVDCCQVLEKYETADITVGVWETTSDISLPAFKCSIIDNQDQAFRRMYAAAGYGCHLTRRIALLRALTEAAQSRLTMISGSRDDVYRTDYERTRNADTLSGIRDELLTQSATRHFHDAPNFEGETFADDLNYAIDRLKEVGIKQVVVVNLTKPMFQIPVVRVVIPGLETNDDIPSFTFGQRALRLTKQQDGLVEA